MKQNGHAAECRRITISANTNTLKAALILENNYHVDFRPEHSICSLLGFNNAVLYIRLPRVGKSSKYSPY